MHEYHHSETGDEPEVSKLVLIYYRGCASEIFHFISQERSLIFYSTDVSDGNEKEFCLHVFLKGANQFKKLNPAL